MSSLPKIFRLTTPPHNLTAHSKNHMPVDKLYTSMVPLSTDTGTAWVPSFAGRLIDIRINVDPGDEPATTATIYDLQINTNSIFASNSERPTIAVGAQSSPVEVCARGSFIAGDSIAYQCTQTGGVNKVIVTLRYRKDR